MTPSYLIIIGLYATILARLGDGPLWNSKIGLEQERCVNSWWINILYVNNYFNTNFLVIVKMFFKIIFMRLSFAVHVPILVFSGRYPIIHRWIVLRLRVMENRSYWVVLNRYFYYSANYFFVCVHLREQVRPHVNGLRAVSASLNNFIALFVLI